jgi:hypothetical protein
MAFDCDASFPFKIHIVKYLVLVFPFCYSVGLFKQTIGQGAFTMVDVCYNTEITDPVHQKEFWETGANI